MTLPGGLDPSKIVAWYAARLMTLNDGDIVVSLTDHSGNGRHGVQATATRRATFQTGELGGHPVFRFVGSQFYKALWGITVPEPYSVFVVHNPKALPPQGGNEVIFSGYTANGTDKHLHAIVNGSIPTVNQPSSPPDWMIEQAGASQHVVGGTPVADTDYLSEIDYEVVADSIIINGVTVATWDAGHLASKGITIGAREDGTRFLVGDIAELVFCRDLTAAEKAAVSAELATVYAIGGVPIPVPPPPPPPPPVPIPPPVNTGDRTEELNAKLAALPVGGTFDLGGKTWRVDGQVVVDSRTLRNGMLDATKHDGLNSVRCVVSKGTNPKCRRVDVQGPGASHPTTFGWHGFASYGAINPVWSECEAFDVFGDAFYIGYRQVGHDRFPTENFLIEYSAGHHWNRMGIAIVAAARGIIRGDPTKEGRGYIGEGRQWCIDIEPAMVEMPVTDVMIDGVTFGAHKLGLLACTGYGARGKYGPVTMRNCKSSHVSLKDWPVVFATIPDGVLSRGPLTVTGNTFTHKGPGPVFKIETGWIAVTEPNTILAG